MVALKPSSQEIQVWLPNQPRTINGIHQELRQTIRQMVGGEAPWPLLLAGPPGTGKTCAGLCLLDYAGGRYFAAQELCETVIRAQQKQLTWQRGSAGGLVSPDQFWRGIAIANLVVLDELGCRERPTDFQLECITRCINERMNRPFVAITNLELADLARVYDARIHSRLAAGTVVRLEGDDRRLNP